MKTSRLIIPLIIAAVPPLLTWLAIARGISVFLPIGVSLIIFGYLSRKEFAFEERLRAAVDGALHPSDPRPRW